MNEEDKKQRRQDMAMFAAVTAAVIILFTGAATYEKILPEDELTDTTTTEQTVEVATTSEAIVSIPVDWENKEFNKVPGPEGYAIIDLPDNAGYEVLPDKISYMLHYILVNDLEVLPERSFLSTYERPSSGYYDLIIGFNTGANINIYINENDMSYHVNKTKEQLDKEEYEKDIFGEKLFTYDTSLVDKFKAWVTEYEGVDNPEVYSVREYKCCYIIWYNHAGVKRFIRIQKEDESMYNRGFYDDVTNEKIVQWSVEGESNDANLN